MGCGIQTDRVIPGVERIDSLAESSRHGGRRAAIHALADHSKEERAHAVRMQGEMGRTGRHRVHAMSRRNAAREGRGRSVADNAADLQLVHRQLSDMQGANRSAADHQAADG